MVLLVFAVIGFALGRHLGTARRGFVTMAAVSIGAAVLQVTHLATTSERSAMTLLPLVIGTVVVASMLVGALVRQPSRPKAA